MSSYTMDHKYGRCIRVFLGMITVADFEVFLWVLLIKQLYHSRLLDVR